MASKEGCYQVFLKTKKIYKIAFSILEKAKEQNINVTLGGNVSNKSFQFISALSKYGLKSFETRKCTFLLDKNKQIIWQHRGYVEGDEYELFDEILKL